MVFDGFCQLIRDRCCHEGPPDKTHAWDVSGMKCGRSLVRLKGGAKSTFCALHKPDSDTIEEASKEEHAERTADRSRAARNASAKRTFAAYDDIKAILCQVSHDPGDREEGRAFLVIWSDLQKTIARASSKKTCSITKH